MCSCSFEVSEMRKAPIIPIQTIARILAEARADGSYSPQAGAIVGCTLWLLADAFAVALAANPDFDRAAFFAACGIELEVDR